MRKFRKVILFVFVAATVAAVWFTFVKLGFNNLNFNNSSVLTSSNAQLSSMPSASAFVDFAADKGIAVPYTGEGLCYLWTAVVFAFACLALTLSVKGGRVRVNLVFPFTLRILVYTLIALFAGIITSVLCAKGNGLPYIFGTFCAFGGAFIWVSAALLLITAAVCFVLYFRQRDKISGLLSSNSVRRSALSAGKVKFDFTILYASLPVFAIYAAASLICLGTYFHIFIPFALATLSIVLWKVTRWRFFFLAGVITVLYHVLTFSCFVCCLLQAGSIPLILLLLSASLPAVISMASIYVRQEKII